MYFVDFFTFSYKFKVQRTPTAFEQPVSSIKDAAYRIYSNKHPPRISANPKGTKS